jgi:hypothetical protein
MDETLRTAAISPLRQHLIDDMNMRRFSHETQRSNIRDVGRFATFPGRSPDMATVDDVRPFAIWARLCSPFNIFTSFGGGSLWFQAASPARQLSGVRSEPISITRSAGSSVIIHRVSRS